MIMKIKMINYMLCQTVAHTCIDVQMKILHLVPTGVPASDSSHTFSSKFYDCVGNFPCACYFCMCLIKEDMLKSTALDMTRIVAGNYESANSTSCVSNTPNKNSENSYADDQVNASSSGY